MYVFPKWVHGDGVLCNTIKLLVGFLWGDSEVRPKYTVNEPLWGVGATERPLGYYVGELAKILIEY